MAFYYIPSGPAPGMAGLGQTRGRRAARPPRGVRGLGQISWADLPGGCPEGQIYDPTTGGCIPLYSPCPEGQIPDPTTGGCIPAWTPGSCPEGQIPDPTTGGCIPMVPVPPTPEEQPPEPDIGTCPQGYVMNENGQCVPASEPPPVPPTPEEPPEPVPGAKEEQPSLVLPLIAGAVGIGLLIWVMRG